MNLLPMSAAVSNACVQWISGVCDFVCLSVCVSVWLSALQK